MDTMKRNFSDSSVDEHSSPDSSRGSTRRSLDALISQHRGSREEPSDTSDMPSLSSFQTNEMSASCASASVASRGDCDMSLPSLSSFRMEDLSMSSSYHSNISGNHQLSEESTEGWSSFTSGNVSADTDDSDRDDDTEFGTKFKASDDRSAGRARLTLPSRSRSRSRSPLSSGTIEEITGIDGDDVDDIDGEDVVSNVPLPSRRAVRTEEAQGSLPMRRPKRTVSPGREERHGDLDSIEKIRAMNALPPKRRSQSPDRTPFERQESLSLVMNALPPIRRSQSPDRTPFERQESLSLVMLANPQTQRDFSVSGSSSFDRQESLSLCMLAKNAPPRDVSVTGSSSTIRAGAGSSSTIRTGTVTATTEGSSSSLRGGDSLPRLPRRTSTLDVSAGDDDSSGISGDGDTRLSEDDVTKASEDLVSIETHEESTLSVEVDDSDEETITIETEPRLDENEDDGDADTESMEDSKLSFSEREKIHTKARKSALENTETTPSTKTSDGTLPASILVPPPSTSTRKSPTSVRTIEDSVARKADESGTVSAEESGTSATETEVDDVEKFDNGEGRKRGRPRILRKVSSSFQRLGKTASFKNSFKMIGRTASKLKQMGLKDGKLSASRVGRAKGAGAEKES